MATFDLIYDTSIDKTKMVNGEKVIFEVIIFLLATNNSTNDTKGADISRFQD